MPKAAYWEHLPWPAIRAASEENHIVIVPCGSVEQHGPHLPSGTDTYIPLGIAQALIEAMPSHQFLIARSLGYGWAKHNSMYQGTISINGVTLISMTNDVLGEIFRQGFSRVLMINGHLENIGFLLEGMETALRDFGNKHSKAVLVNWWEFVDDSLLADVFGDRWPGWEAEHAALTETSLMLYLWPDLVSNEPVPDAPYKHLKYSVLPWPEKARPASGVYASIQGASPKVGQRLVEAIVEGVVSTVEEEF